METMCSKLEQERWRPKGLVMFDWHKGMVDGVDVCLI